MRQGTGQNPSQKEALPLCELQSDRVPRTSELRATCTFPDGRGDASQVLPPLWVADSAGRLPWVPSQAHGGVWGRDSPSPHAILGGRKGPKRLVAGGGVVGESNP